MAKEKTILSIEELQSLHDLVWSEDIENVMIGVSIIKGTEMTNELRTWLVKTSFFHPNGAARTKLKAVLRKNFPKEVYQECMKALKGVDVSYVTMSITSKIHDFLTSLLEAKDLVDLKSIVTLTLEKYRAGYLFAIQNNLFSVYEAMEFMLQTPIYCGHSFSTTEEFIQEEVNELPALSKKYPLDDIRISCPDNKKVEIPADFSTIERIKKLTISGFLELPKELNGVDIELLSFYGELKVGDKASFPMIKGIEGHSIFNNLLAFSNLESFQLRHLEELEGLPQEFLALKKLKKLELNYVRKSNYDQIFEVISKLSTLTELSLSHCQMKYVPEKIGELTNLKRLDLTLNNLRDDLPKSILKLQQLEFLDISQNQLQGFPKILLDLPKLTKVARWHSGASTYGYKGELIEKIRERFGDQ